MARLVCDDCWADLDPDVSVTVTFCTCAPAGAPFGVIRQRARAGPKVPGPGAARHARGLIVERPRSSSRGAAPLRKGTVTTPPWPRWHG